MTPSLEATPNLGLTEREYPMVDSTFGELAHDGYGWVRETTVDWLGEPINVDLVVWGEEDEDIEPLQRESYEHLIAAWNNVESEILDGVLSYYTSLRSELGFDDNSNDDYPDVSTAEGIRDIIGLDTIVVPSSDIYDGRSIALAFHCTWDDENGLGVVLVDEEVREVGYQDIAL